MMAVRGQKLSTVDSPKGRLHHCAGKLHTQVRPSEVFFYMKATIFCGGNNSSLTNKSEILIG